MRPHGAVGISIAEAAFKSCLSLSHLAGYTVWILECYSAELSPVLSLCPRGGLQGYWVTDSSGAIVEWVVHFR
jgi:hypothetical protein